MTYTRYVTICVVSVSALLALSACCSAPKRGNNNAGELKVLTESDANRRVVVEVGSPVDIQLPANATTGFNWKLTRKEGASVEQKGEMQYVTNPHPEGMVGVGGTASFHFIAKQPGATTLQFEYARPWEKVPPAKTYSVTIEAK